MGVQRKSTALGGHVSVAALQRMFYEPNSITGTVRKRAPFVRRFFFFCLFPSFGGASFCLRVSSLVHIVASGVEEHQNIVELA